MLVTFVVVGVITGLLTTGGVSVLAGGGTFVLLLLVLLGTLLVLFAGLVENGGLP